MTVTLAPIGLTLADAARMIREATKDKSYRAYPLGQEAGHYLRFKRKRLTKDSYRDYEACLDKIARFFPDLAISDFEPPIGTERVEEFLEQQWGHREPRTYNKNLSIVGDFFEWQVLRGSLHGDPTLPITRAKARGVYRTVFTDDQIRALIAANPGLRDRVALRLVAHYGLRKGALQTVRFQHFDHSRRQLTIFTKGGKVPKVPIPHQPFWHDLERLILDTQARPEHFLLQRRKAIPKGKPPNRAPVIHVFPDKPMGAHGLHDWWYGCLERAGIVPAGVTRGERMHKGRHTAGQRVLDKTGNLKAAQKLLGHSSIQTTGDQYTDWDIDQLTATMRDVLEDAE